MMISVLQSEITGKQSKKLPKNGKKQQPTANQKNMEAPQQGRNEGVKKLATPCFD